MATPGRPRQNLDRSTATPSRHQQNTERRRLLQRTEAIKQAVGNLRENFAEDQQTLEKLHEKYSARVAVQMERYFREDFFLIDTRLATWKVGETLHQHRQQVFDLARETEDKMSEAFQCEEEPVKQLTDDMQRSIGRIKAVIRPLIGTQM